MAKPIGKTPVFEGEDAIAILKKMKEPPTKKDKDFAKKLDLKEEYYSKSLRFNSLNFLSSHLISFKSK